MIVDNAFCKVELLKLDYDQPGTDTGDFVELFVTQKGSPLNSLGDCGIGAMVLYDSGSCLTPYLVVPLQNVAVPSDGYVEICSGAGCDVNAATGAYLHDGPSEIGFVGVTAPGVPMLWVSYEGTATCVPAGTTPPVTQAQTEGNSSPNLTNVWCGAKFTLVDASLAVKRAPNKCPDAGSGGGGGTGGTAATGGTGGTAATGGTGGTAATGGTGGTAATGGTGGTAATGGSGGTAATGGTGGTAATGGTGGTAATGGTGGTAATGGTGGTAATGGSGGTGGGAASGGTGASAGTGASGGSGGSAASGGGGAGAADAGLGLKDIAIEGGGCACGVARQSTHGAAGFALALLAIGARRRRTRSRQEIACE